jgi:transcription elongation factor SPT6
MLQKEDDGEFYFRPSSRGPDNLTLTWKFYKTNIVHIDIKEEQKAPGANIGSKLVISMDSYDNLQEIVDRYILPCNRSLREVTMNPKFFRATNLKEIELALANDKKDNAQQIPYKFSILDEYPQYVILAYMPKD